MSPDDIRRLVPNGGRALFDRFLAAGQVQVFRFFAELAPDERDALLEQARSIDLDEVARLIGSVSEEPSPGSRVEPIAAIEPDDPESARALDAGREAFSDGRVAFLTVAGGQATRLGCEIPKGCYPVAPVSGKTLFRWHAEKVLAASRRYGAAVPWLVMVSEENAEPTLRYFREEKWFGLEGRVRFLRQRMLPAVDGKGRILLASRSRIATSPNGHGGTLEALGRSGAIEWLVERGIDLISYFQVDNALLNAADPAFLGHHVLRSAEMSAKVVWKRDPLEKAGVVCARDGKPGVVEYTEISEDLARAVDEEGRLLLGLANIAAHVFSVPLLDRLQGVGLPYHSALKEIPTVDEDGAPTKVLGRKFETFIFDAIPLARGFNVFLTERSQEFSPLKNAEGENTPETVRAALLERSRSWFEGEGLAVPERSEDLEIGPLAAYDRETFRDHLRLSLPGGAR